MAAAYEYGLGSYLNEFRNSRYRRPSHLDGDRTAVRRSIQKRMGRRKVCETKYARRFSRLAAADYGQIDSQCLHWDIAFLSNFRSPAFEVTETLPTSEKYK